MVPPPPTHVAPPPGPPRPWRSPRRLALAALGVGVAVVASTWLGQAPREVALVYRLGPSHALVTRAEVAYEHGGEEVARLLVSHPDGAPSRVRHVVTLPAGRTRIVARTERAGVVERWVRAVDVPVEGEALVDLYDGPGPRRTR